MKTPLSYIEISRDNVIHNFKTIKSFVSPSTKIACVVKGNAYGHGLAEVAKILDRYADYFQVDDLQELRELRKISEKPALVFGYVAKDELEEAIKHDAILSIYDLERLGILDKLARKQNKKVKIHVKIDANLGRQGILLDEVEGFVSQLNKFTNIIVDGVYSHFANIEDTTDFSHAQKQIRAFQKAVKIFADNGFTKIKKHISATSGILAYEKRGKSDIVRPGIGLYGMWPSEELRGVYGSFSFELKPVARWISHVAQVKSLPANFSIGYGLTYITKKPTKIAIIPQGYSDGYDRGFSNKGEVLISGVRCRVLGRIAMNMFAVDVTGSDVQVEDEVVLLGKQGKGTISAEESAEKIGTINYEITARISPLIPRIVV